MIKLENYEVVGWEHAIRGMRNPMNSWDRSDSYVSTCELMGSCEECPHKGSSICVTDTIEVPVVGPNDHELMMKLANGGPVHAKYRRMIIVYVDITAPLYWWKEFDTYKVGTVANSCSTMHKIHEKEFTLDDFSHEHLMRDDVLKTSIDILELTIDALNIARKFYLESKNKLFWWQMIQLLPSSYNQKRTVMFNYEVLCGIYNSRKSHKLDEWRELCSWIEKLPYSEIITGQEANNDAD